MNGDVNSLIDTVDAARDEQMVKNALKNFGNAVGYDRFAYLQADGSEIHTFDCYPSPWRKVYFDSNYAVIDPVVRQAKLRREIFGWSADDWPSRGSSALRRFRDEAIEQGICSGVTIPAKGSFGSTLMLTFATADREGSQLCSLDPKEALRIVLAVHYRLEIIGARTAIAPKSMPSPRELICIKWAIKGRTAEETALLTGIKPRSVQAYLDNARRKFDAKTVPQLVGIVKDRGLA